MIQLLQGNDYGKKLMKADVFAAARLKLEREITNNEYLKVFHFELSLSLSLSCVLTKVWFRSDSLRVAQVMNDLCETNSSGWVLQKAR